MEVLSKQKPTGIDLAFYELDELVSSYKKLNQDWDTPGHSACLTYLDLLRHITAIKLTLEPIHTAERIKEGMEELRKQDVKRKTEEAIRQQREAFKNFSFNYRNFGGSFYGA